MSTVPRRGGDVVSPWCGPDYPIRQRSAKGIPRPTTSIERICAECGASFLGLAPGKTRLRGLWTPNFRWFCSQECFDQEAASPMHHGGYVWRNSAEQVWECDDDCPHPTHDDDWAVLDDPAPIDGARGGDDGR